MGQSALILTLAATGTILILLMVIGRNTKDADDDLAGYHYKVLAREASATGLGMTVRRLVDDTDNWLANPSQYEYPTTAHHGATFSTEVLPIHEDTVDVISTGVEQRPGGATTHVIEARYAKGFMNLGVPPGLKYAIFSDKTLTLNGQANITAVHDTMNANIHTNGSLTSNGNKVTVEGYGTYEHNGSGTVNPEKAMDDVFSPNDDTNGSDPNMHASDSITVPTFIAADYLPYATYVTAGDTSFSGVIDFTNWNGISGFGTADDPYLLYVSGNLTISGNSTFLGYVQVVAEGTITISGDVTATTTPPPDKDAPEADWDAWTMLNLDAAGNTSIGWFAEQDITLSGNFNVVGQLYTNMDVVLNGGGGQPTNIIGGITSSDLNLNVNGGVNIRYASISESVLLPGWTHIAPVGVRLIAYAEW